MALHGLGLMDTAPEECFDRITRLAARSLSVPIVLVSLVDESRQWFKSCVGLDTGQTSREISFALLCVGASDEATLCLLAERVRSQINKASVGSALGPVSFSASFGIAGSSMDDAGWKDIYARADAALYAAKASGKNRVVCAPMSAAPSRASSPS
jgi:hypothetical protein